MVTRSRLQRGIALRITAFLLFQSIAQVLVQCQVPTPDASVAGQSNAATPVPWSTVEDKKEGFSIDLPADWNVINLDKESIAGLIEALKKMHPESAEWYSSQLPALVAQGMKLMAVEVTPSSLKRNYSANVNLIVQDLPIAVSSSYLAQASEAVMSKMMAGKVLPTPTAYHCAKLDGALIEFDQETSIADGSLAKIHVRQLYVAHGTRAVVLSFSSPLGEDTTYAATFNRIAGSLAMLDIPGGNAPADWQRYSIGASGVSMELPQQPGAIDMTGKLVPQDGFPLIGRFFRFSGNESGVSFGILEGAYASGEAKEVCRLFLNIMASALTDVGQPKPALTSPSDKAAADLSSETVVEGLPAFQWENISGEKGNAIHTKAVVVAENRFVYFIWLSYGESDKASSEKASRMLGSINIEQAVEENSASVKQPSLKKSGPELLAKEWKKYVIGLSGISMKLPAFPDKLDKIPVELAGISAGLEGESYAYIGDSIIFDLHSLKAKPKGGILLDLLSGAVYARRLMLERMGFDSKSITTKAVSGDTIEMTATKNGEPAFVETTLLIQRKENLWIVGAQYRADDAVAAKAAERALRSVHVPKDGNQ